MNHTLLIAARDVRDKGSLYLVSAVLAVMPFLALLLPSSTGRHRDVLMGFGGILALAVGLGLALGLGLSTFGRALSEKRMSFWFSKPISPSALWMGKSLAALFTSLACFAIILGPSVLVAGKRAWMRYGGAWNSLAGLIVLMLVLYLVGHTGSTMVRSRSVALGLDFLAIIVTGAIGLLLLRPLLFQPIFRDALLTLAGALVAVLMIAPYWQLRNGRTDLRRSHAALSRAIWTGTAIVLALGTLAFLWITGGKPDDFDRIVSLEQAPSGNAVMITGSAPYRRGVTSTFLHDWRTGKDERLHVLPYHGTAYSRNGRFAAWVQPGLLNWSGATLIVRDLIANESNVLNVQTSVFATVIFSDDGDRIAVKDGPSLTVYERASGKILAAIPMKEGRHIFFFVGNDALRFFQSAGPGETEIHEFRISTKVQSRLGSVGDWYTSYGFSFSEDGSLMLIKSKGLLVDGRTGATIATLPNGASGSMLASAMLSDGRVLIGRMSDPAMTNARDPGTTQMAIYSAAGRKQYEVTIADRVLIVGERADGKVILMGLRREDRPSIDARGRSMYLLDVNRGVLEKTVPDTKGPGPQWSADPRLVRYSANTRFAAVDKDGKLTYWQ